LILRVDDRLIHGQIVYGWAKLWPAEEIWLVHDAIAADTRRRELYEEQIPEGVTGGVLSLSEAVDHWGGSGEESRRILLVVESCADLARLVAEGVRPAEAHLGNVGRGEGRGRVTDTVYLGGEDLAALETVAGSGVSLWLRELPSSRPLPLP